MFLTIVIVAFLATFLSSMSGAGSGMITIPVWLMLGYSMPTALAAGKVSGALWTPVAARNYLKKEHVDWRLIAGLVSFGLVGAYLGALVVLSLDPRILQRIVGCLTLTLVAFSYLRPNFGITPKPPALNRMVTSALAFPLGFYEAFFGSGNGLFTSIMLSKARGFDLAKSLGYYYIVTFAWCAFAAYLYIHNGNGDLGLIIPSSIGALLGAMLGSSIGSRKGSRFVKNVAMGLGGVLGLKLLLGI